MKDRHRVLGMMQLASLREMPCLSLGVVVEMYVRPLDACDVLRAVSDDLSKVVRLFQRDGMRQHDVSLDNEIVTRVEELKGRDAVDRVEANNAV